MSDMNIPAPLVRWSAAFLKDRVQSVKIGETISECCSLNGGIPQGTLLGPKGFLIQINDLVTCCQISKYVDDSTIYEVCDKQSDSHLQQAADETLSWSKVNDMIINADKTKELVICFCRDADHHTSIPNITMDGNVIEQVSKTKVLGVTITDDLTWNAHVDLICGQGAQTHIHALPAQTCGCITIRHAEDILKGRFYHCFAHLP